MRTRRSPRSQERLYKALGGPRKPPANAGTVESLTRQLEAAEANLCIPRRTVRAIKRELLAAQARETVRRVRGY